MSFGLVSLTNSSLGSLNFREDAGKDSICGIILGHVRDVGVSNLLASVALFGKKEGLVLQHLLIHVRFLELHHGEFDLVVTIDPNLFSLKPVLQQHLCSLVLLNGEALRLLIFLDSGFVRL